MEFADIIEKKKRGLALSEEEINFFVKGAADSSIADIKLAAFLMAVVLKGMTDDETIMLTRAMAASGKRGGNFGEKGGIIFDKHSTGGVSDTTTLIVVPVCCALGYKFAKLSGRGLGFTGGTLDKLEVFDGIDVGLSQEKIEEIVERVGGVITGQTDETVPADKRLYALRDVTCTVDSIPLIASSVMSKKLASFANVIVLDVKFGSGAFMADAEEAERLASLMVKIGRAEGRKTYAVISSMDFPLGGAVGCNAEVKSALDVLSGKKDDLYVVSKALAAKLLEGAGMERSEAESAFDRAISSGAAKEKLKEIVAAQGGKTDAIDDPTLLRYGRYSMPILCEKGGFLNFTDARAIGYACVDLGGGRRNKGDKIDKESAIEMKLAAGDFAEKGDAVAVLYSNDENKLKVAADRLKNAFVFGENKEERHGPIHKIL